MGCLNYLIVLIQYQAETSEDLFEWKTALEQALAQAPSAALVMGHNGIFRSDTSDSIEGSFHQCLCLLFITSCPFVLILLTFLSYMSILVLALLVWVCVSAGF